MHRRLDPGFRFVPSAPRPAEVGDDTIVEHGQHKSPDPREVSLFRLSSGDQIPNGRRVSVDVLMPAFVDPKLARVKLVSHEVSLARRCGIPPASATIVQPASECQTGEVQRLAAQTARDTSAPMNAGKVIEVTKRQDGKEGAEIQIAGRLLFDAGIKVGDQVAVEVVRSGELLVRRISQSEK